MGDGSGENDEIADGGKRTSPGAGGEGWGANEVSGAVGEVSGGRGEGSDTDGEVGGGNRGVHSGGSIDPVISVISMIQHSRPSRLHLP